MKSFISAGRGYVETGANSIGMASGCGILDISYSSGGSDANGIIRVTHDPDCIVTANYPRESYGFVFRPGWITHAGAGVQVAASIVDSPDFLMGTLEESE
ncbi:MAG: hypothetical protein ACOZCF_03650 [Bacillota bacterium]